MDKKEEFLNNWEKSLEQREKQLIEKERLYKLGLAFINGNYTYLNKHYNDYDYIDTSQINHLSNQ